LEQQRSGPAGARIGAPGGNPSGSNPSGSDPSGSNPSGSNASGNMTGAAEPLRVLECGAGTGAFTGRILRLLRAGDRLDVVELNPLFAAELRRRAAQEPQWRETPAVLAIHETPLEKFALEHAGGGYDFIISGLPHVNFPPEAARDVVASYRRLLKPGGTLSYFEYAYIRPLRRLATLGKDSARIRAVDQTMGELIAAHESARATVLANFPPAWVRHLRSPTRDD
jgi:phospholipid N-methyltransferase